MQLHDVLLVMKLVISVLQCNNIVNDFAAAQFQKVHLYLDCRKHDKKQYQVSTYCTVFSVLKAAAVLAAFEDDQLLQDFEKWTNTSKH